MPSKPIRTLAFWIMISLLIVLAVHFYRFSAPREERVTYSKLLEEVEKGNIKTYTQAPRTARGEFVSDVAMTKEGLNIRVKHFTVFLPVEDRDLIQLIRERNPAAVIDGAPPGTNWVTVVLSYLPILILAFWVFRLSGQIRRLGKA